MLMVPFRDARFFNSSKGGASDVHCYRGVSIILEARKSPIDSWVKVTINPGDNFKVLEGYTQAKYCLDIYQLAGDQWEKQTAL